MNAVTEIPLIAVAVGSFFMGALAARIALTGIRRVRGKSSWADRFFLGE